jgi:hypothetical protein
VHRIQGIEIPTKADASHVLKQLSRDGEYVRDSTGLGQVYWRIGAISSNGS